MMKWLRRILDERKTSKDENRQKAIHDLLTMNKADMVDLVRKLNKGVKRKNKIYAIISFILYSMLFAFPAYQITCPTICHPGLVLLYLITLLFATPFIFYAIMLVSSKLAFNNNLSSYLKEFVSITSDTKYHKKSAYMDCLSQSETWKRTISGSELERPMKTIMDYLHAKDVPDRYEVTADTLKAILPAMILDHETKYEDQHVMDETISTYHIKENLEHIADGLSGNSEKEIGKIWDTTKTREKTLKENKEILTKSADNARLEDLKKRLDQSITDIDGAINDIDKTIKSIHGKAD